MLKVAIIGYGGIAGAHAPSWQLLEERGKAKLVAVCDIDPDNFSATVETNINSGRELPADVRTYTDYKEMLANEELDLVDICLPTPLHKDVTIDVLNSGINVQCEKPMARNYAQTQEMIAAAKASGKILMIGLGLRFAVEYEYVKKLIESGEYGRPVAASFQRLSGPPLWSRWHSWYMNHEESGGCLLDMHIHDVDMVRHLFGEPKAVSCVTQDLYAGDDVVHSRFIYDDLAVTAVGDWSLEGTGFYCGYRIAFEKATVICEMSKVTVYPRGGEAFEPELNGDNFFTRELTVISDAVAGNGEVAVTPPQSAAKSIRLCELLKESANANGAIVSCDELKD
ncbi:MAG: Gfo/Idh/MocA family oxidoreductase [Clostridia bacterium]|nr:Gfo/Idh/MocA family oxidoreductase [Clostridia bacterium]